MAFNRRRKSAGFQYVLLFKNQSSSKNSFWESMPTPTCSVFLYPPSGKNTRALILSESITVSIWNIFSSMRLSSTGVAISTLLSVLRVMRSALEIYIFRAAPLPRNNKSANVPEICPRWKRCGYCPFRPGPGKRQQIPLTMREILTPLLPAR